MERQLTFSLDQWTFELKTQIGVLWSDLRTNNAAFDHAMAGRTMGNEPWRHGHFDDNVLVARHAFYGNERASGTDVESGAEFQDRAAVGVGSVDKNGKCDGEPLPSPRLVLGFTHE